MDYVYVDGVEYVDYDSAYDEDFDVASYDDIDYDACVLITIMVHIMFYLEHALLQVIDRFEHNVSNSKAIALDFWGLMIVAIECHYLRLGA